MKFTKMHGIGNDYVYVNCMEEDIADPNTLAISVSDRHFGIGSDGLIMICRSNIADFRMRMFNADGSEGEMCGNGIRCVGKYVFDKGLTSNTTVRIETLAGIKVLLLTVKDGCVEKVKVDMGEPVLIPAEIPVLIDGDTCISKDISTVEDNYKATCVSMGNPHAVIYVDSVDAIDIEKKGPLMENHKVFPNRVNTEFVEILENKELKMRVWERGSGETLACGTGACAVLVASVLNGKSPRTNTVHLLGGDLIIEWNEKDNHVYMTGSATTVFEGEIKI